MQHSILNKGRSISHKCNLAKIPIKTSRLSVMACQDLNHSRIVSLIRVITSSTNKGRTLRCLKIRDITSSIRFSPFINQVIQILSTPSRSPSPMPFSISSHLAPLTLTQHLKLHLCNNSSSNSNSSNSSSDPPSPLSTRWWTLSRSSWGPWLRKSTKTTSWQGTSARYTPRSMSCSMIPILTILTAARTRTRRMSKRP